MPKGSGVPLEVRMHGRKGSERLLRRREEMLARGMPQAKANAATAAELVRWLWALGAMCRVRAGHDGLPVAQVQERLGIPASTLSHHLQRLIRNGLVSQERQATTLICRAVYPAMDALLGFLSDECCIEEVCSASSGKAA
nr:helix-turn-helix domain-containing protein [Bosea sp. REN20]